MKHRLHDRLSTGHYIFGVIYLVAQQFAIPWLLVLGAALLDLHISNLWFNFIFFSVNFVVIAAVFCRFLRGEVRRFFANPVSAAGYALAGFALYWVANLYISVAIAFLLPNFSNANDATIQIMAQEHYWVMFAGSVLLVPMVEETLYRGVIFGFVDRFNRPLAYILSTLLFAFVHVVGYIGTTEPVMLLVSLVQYLPAGIFLCWAYTQSGTLLTPILIHTAVNLIGMAAMR